METIEILISVYIILIALSIGFIFINWLLTPKQHVLRSIQTDDDIRHLIAQKDIEESKTDW